jgi:hypothetical protein
MAWNDALELAVNLGADLSQCVPIDLKNSRYRNHSIEALESEKVSY